MEPEVTQAEVVYLPDRLKYVSLLRDEIFINCEIVGPAIILLDDSTGYEGTVAFDMAERPQDLFWERRKGELATGAILPYNCRIIDCRFRNIGFAGTAAFWPWFVRSFHDGRWTPRG